MSHNEAASRLAMDRSNFYRLMRDSPKSVRTVRAVAHVLRVDACEVFKWIDPDEDPL